MPGPRKAGEAGPVPGSYSNSGPRCPDPVGMYWAEPATGGAEDWDYRSGSPARRPLSALAIGGAFRSPGANIFLSDLQLMEVFETGTDGGMRTCFRAFEPDTA